MTSGESSRATASRISLTCPQTAGSLPSGRSNRAHSRPASRCRRGPGERPLRPAAPAGLYQGGPVGAHMHDPSATRSDKVGIMIGTWLAALLKTPHRIHLCGGTDTKVRLIPGSEGRGW
jgi:hypothetical protein